LKTLFVNLEQDAEKKTKDKFSGFKLMTSVSIPVYDKKNHTVSDGSDTYVHTYICTINSPAS
jgi:hypothetical protein